MNVDDVDIVVCGSSLLHLLGTTITWKVDAMGARLEFPRFRYVLLCSGAKKSVHINKGEQGSNGRSKVCPAYRGTYLIVNCTSCPSDPPSGGESFTTTFVASQPTVQTKIENQFLCLYPL